MSTSRRFCLRCGRSETPDGPLVEGLCLDCFLRERHLVRLPSKVTLVRCTVCGSLYIKGSWTPFHGGVTEALQYYLREAVLKKDVVNPNLSGIDIDVLGIYGGHAELLIRASLKGRLVEQKLATTYEVVGRLCPRCLNSKVRNYEAVLQIRFTGDPPRDLVRRIARILGESRSISESVTDYEELHEGVDVKFSNVSVARHAATYLQNLLGGYVTESWKLHGVVKGRRYSKVSIVLRIPLFSAGDLIDLRGSLVEVLEVRRDKVVVHALREGRVMNLSLRSLIKEGFRVLDTADYSVTKCFIADIHGNEAVAECEDGDLVRSVITKPLKVGDAVLALTYKDVKYLKY
ncbi:MAG: NMD3-related protein [Zestosphaera sp.]